MKLPGEHWSQSMLERSYFGYDLQPPYPTISDVAKAAVIETAARSPGRRGPYVFDEEALQATAASLKSERA